MYTNTVIIFDHDGPILSTLVAEVLTDLETAVREINLAALNSLSLSHSDLDDLLWLPAIDKVAKSKSHL